MTDCEHNDKNRFIIQLNKSLIETEFCMDCGESMNCLQRLKDLKAELERKMTRHGDADLTIFHDDEWKQIWKKRGM